ncbi:MAG: hypothetical protein WD066_03755, partial [Planctomycetaceae bacterium]
MMQDGFVFRPLKDGPVRPTPSAARDIGRHGAARLLMKPPGGLDEVVEVPIVEEGAAGDDECRDRGHVDEDVVRVLDDPFDGVPILHRFAELGRFDDALRRELDRPAPEQTAVRAFAIHALDDLPDAASMLPGVQGDRAQSQSSERRDENRSGDEIESTSNRELPEADRQDAPDDHTQNDSVSDDALSRRRILMMEQIELDDVVSFEIVFDGHRLGSFSSSTTPSASTTLRGTNAVPKFYSRGEMHANHYKPVKIDLVGRSDGRVGRTSVRRARHRTPNSRRR